MKKCVIPTCLVACAMSVSSVMAAPPAFQAEVLSDEPLLYYQLNETQGVAVNYGSLGSDFDGTYSGGMIRGVETSEGDTGVLFSSASDFIESMSAAPTELTGNPAFTVEVVVRIPSGSVAALWPPFLQWGAPGTGNSVYFSLRENQNNKIYAGFYNAGLSMQGTIPNDLWLHAVMVREEGGNAMTGTTLYVNGESVALIPDPALCCNNAIPTVTSTTFLINRGTDFTRYFEGTMDELVLYDRALTAEEVCNHYQLLDFCVADSNDDNTVDVNDLLAVLGSWGTCEGCPQDFDGSGAVDVTDLLYLLGQWGPCPCSNP